jgi:hypothetical protein
MHVAEASPSAQILSEVLFRPRGFFGASLFGVLVVVIVAFLIVVIVVFVVVFIF